MTETDRLVEVGKLARYLAAGEVSLGDVVARALEKQPGTDRLLLVVNQWEELYTLTADAAANGCFIDALLTVTESVPLAVVATLRGDFFGQTLAHRPLADRLQDAVVPLGPMTRAELTRAIVEPTRKLGLDLEAGLTERLLDDVGQEPGNLPLLEFVLTGLWEARRGGQMHHAAYAAMGGVQGAMAQRAEAVFAGLSPPEQDLLRRTMMRLVRPGEGTEDTRRRASLAELGQAAIALVRQLADAHLVVIGYDAANDQETVEVAHETLIRHGQRLRGWLDEDRTFLL